MGYKVRSSVMAEVSQKLEQRILAVAALRQSFRHNLVESSPFFPSSIPKSTTTRTRFRTTKISCRFHDSDYHLRAIPDIIAFPLPPPPPPSEEEQNASNRLGPSAWSAHSRTELNSSAAGQSESRRHACCRGSLNLRNLPSGASGFFLLRRSPDDFYERVRTSNRLVSASIRRSSKPSRRRIEFTSSFSALNGGAVAGADTSHGTETCRTAVFRLSGIGPPQPDNIDALQPSSNFGSSWSWRRQSESSSNFADSWSMISNLQSSISGRRTSRPSLSTPSN
ncbi:hypothetical protein TIFTF001_001410 [Ficus carica]|uniref:Uncharacterized protein n=1 Tax=Ficus carica TaxID=3494 RepID=A0AA87Z1I5_FICCA|nr:hypothetical protein TIFTF001_001410 [Ficus carica]